MPSLLTSLTLLSRRPSRLTGPAGSAQGRRWRQWRRWSDRHRRALTAALAGVCLLATVQALEPPTGGTTAVLVAAHDVDGGQPLTAGDLALARLPPPDVPAGAFTSAADVVGRTLAGPVSRGEPLTDARLVGPGLVDALSAGLVAVPVRIGDAGAVALLRAGDRVDVLAAPADPSTGGVTTVTAAGVRVLLVPAATDSAGADPATDGALVVLATTARQALSLAAAAAADRLSLTLLAG